ncbi:MAG: thiopurine S-methyltransferase [Gammaproteobacteria bacterium]|nr:MAG: thiopurine S-methyltransferase [Gammaproteobacteria bacterium]
MESDFWQQRWREQRIGWHQPKVNAWLREYWASLELPPGSRVFVPLCGKSLDMLWLVQQSHEVVGVELSSLALASFCEEHGLQAEQQEEERFVRHHAQCIHLLEGDFFHLRPSDLGKVQGVWDRAALVALPEPMRGEYARHLASLLDPGTQVLLVTMEYPAGEMEGPPFSVSAAEVQEIFGGAFHVKLLETGDMLAGNPSLRERGLNRLVEQVWQLRRF